MSAEWENCAVVLCLRTSRPQPLSLASGCPSHCPQIFPQPHGESGAHGSTPIPYPCHCQSLLEREPLQSLLSNRVY